MLTGLRGVGKTVLLNALRSWRSSGTGAPERSRPAPTSRCVGRCPARCTWRCARSPRGTATRAGHAVPRCPQSVCAQGQHQRRPAARPLGARDRCAGGVWPRRHGRHRGRPGRVVRRRGGCSLRMSAAGSRCSSTRCRTYRRPTCRRCAPPATSCRSKAGHSLWWGRGCHTFQRCCRRRSPTASGCSRTCASIGSTARRRPRARAPGQGGGRRLRAVGAGRALRGDRRLPLLRTGLRQGRLGPRARLSGHCRRHRGGRT